MQAVHSAIPPLERATQKRIGKMARFSTLLLSTYILTVACVTAELEKVGEIRTLQYMVAGTVYIMDENTLKIEDFTYDGKGPDAFFYVGESGSPSGSGTIVPYPEGSGTDAVLTKADKIDITLRLPAGK